MPEFVEERYLDPTGRKALLKETKNYYTPHGRLERQEVFDAHHQLKYELKWEYDDHGNVTSETNALGETVIRKFDDNNNLIYQKGPSPDVEIKNTYDYSDRLIKQEKIHTNGDCFVTSYEYDYLGNCTAITNPYGHVTLQKFDDFGRIIETHYPPIQDEAGQIVNPINKKKYNVSGQPIRMIDAKGRTTFFEYNSQGSR